MIKLGVNTVLFSGHDLESAMRCISLAGYDGVELSALAGMCEHLVLDDWRAQANRIKGLAEKYELELLSMEVGALAEERLIPAFEAGQAIGIPVVNIGPGGQSDNEEDFERQTDLMAQMASKAADYGVKLCVKAHVNCCIYNTPTSLRALEKIQSPAFALDMDPSHVHRSGENPEEALPQVVDRTGHIHIRDCKGRGPTPGTPTEQACGRGDINLRGYCEAMVKGNYDGPVCLEVIGAVEHGLPHAATIAAESYGYLNCVLKELGAR